MKKLISLLLVLTMVAAMAVGCTTAPEATVKTAEITVTDVKTYTVDGNTVFYFLGNDNIFYKGILKDNEDLIFITVGASLSIKYTDSDNAAIKNITSVEIVAK